MRRPEDVCDFVDNADARLRRVLEVQPGIRAHDMVLEAAENAMPGELKRVKAS